MSCAGESCDMAGLTTLNALSPHDFEELLLGCCAAPGWARQVTEGRPYESVAELIAAGDAAWAARDPGDLDAAMAGHPRIGERRLSGWSAREQAGVG
jgi:2-oxo-4-hydroxy-4-carboxy-5-ureidoimidazoline decarboxylase